MATSRKPIFSQEGKAQAPNASLTNFQKTDPRLSQQLKKSDIMQPIQPISGVSSIFNSTAYASNNRDELQMSQVSYKSVDESTLSRLVKDIIDKEGFMSQNNAQRDDLVKRDITILAQHIKEQQKSIEMLRTVYFEQKNQSQQSMAQGVQEKFFKQIHSIEESVASKISSAQDQLVQHQEIFQSSFSQKLQDLRTQIESIKTSSSVNDNKLNKCIQFIAKIDVQEDFINQTNNKIGQLEQALSMQVKQAQSNNQNYVQMTTKKLMEQIEVRFNELQGPRASSKQDNSPSITSIDSSEIVALKRKLSEISDRSANQQAFTNEVNSNLEKLRFEFQGSKDDSMTFRKEVKDSIAKTQRAYDDFRMHFAQELSKSQDQVHGIAMRMQENIENLNNALELRLKLIEKQQFASKKNEILFSFNQRTEGEYQSKDFVPYSINSEKLEIESPVQHLGKPLPAHDDHVSFQSVEVETFEYAENKFIDEEERLPTESDVVEIGTTKGENKESLLERFSEMRRLPDISERLEEYDSIELPTQQVASIQDPFVPQTNQLLTESEFNNQAQVTEESRIINEDQEEEVTYQLDENGYLMDEEGSYILDDDGQMIQLDGQQIEYLKEKQMVREEY